MFLTEAKIRKILDKVLGDLNKQWNDYDMDLRYRFEDNNVVVFDANENISIYEDEYSFLVGKLENILQEAFDNKDLYLEWQNNIVMVIADIWVKGE